MNKVSSPQQLKGVETLNTRTILTAVIFVTSLLSSLSALAADSDYSPLGVGLFPPLQLPNSGYGITGLRLTLVGVHRESQGIDIGLLGNVTNKSFKGLSLSGLFNYNSGLSTVVGLQAAGLANINIGASKVYGVQFAGYNTAGTVYGLQLGLVNVANDLHGIQIGLFNINKTGFFKGSPLINIGF